MQEPTDVDVPKVMHLKPVHVTNTLDAQRSTLLRKQTHQTLDPNAAQKRSRASTALKPWGRSMSLGIFERVLVGLEDALLDELFGRRASLQVLLEAVGAHVALELLLVALERGRRR